jgi:hypothetical protein
MFAVTLEAEGLDMVTQMIDLARGILDAAGNTIGGVDLHAKKRLEDEADSVIIAKQLMEFGRDFFSLDDAQSEQVAQAFANEVQRRLDGVAGMAIGVSGVARAVGKASAEGTRMATETAGAAYRGAMMRYMAIVSENITAQRTAFGGSPDALSPEYAEWKQENFGFTSPIGVATGQLRENFDPSNKGNIRLRTFKSLKG